MCSLHHAGRLFFKFTTDADTQGQGWYLRYRVLPPPTCQHQTIVDFSNMLGNSAMGWLASDYSARLASGHSTQYSAPAGSAGSWLSGYAPNSNCRYMIKTPPGSNVMLSMQHINLASGDKVDLLAATSAWNSSIATVRSWSGTTASSNTNVTAEAGPDGGLNAA